MLLSGLFCVLERMGIRLITFNLKTLSHAEDATANQTKDRL